MSRLKRWPRASEANATIRRFEPAYWSLDFNLDMVATVVTTGANSLRVKALFRTNLDLAGLIWQVEDKTDHGLFRYGRRRDWRGCTVAFNWASSGIRAMDKLQSVTLTVETWGGETHFVRLWNYATGTPDACAIAFTCDATTRSGYSADAAVPWHDIKRLFISLQPTNAGRGDCSLAGNLANGATTASVNVGDSGPVRPGAQFFVLGASNGPFTVSSTTTGAVQAITFAPAIATASAATLPTGTEAFLQPAPVDVGSIGESPAEITISALVVGGSNATTPIRTTAEAAGTLRMTDGYDNAYPVTPERIVEQTWRLGYRGQYVLYMGISKFHSMTFDVGENRYIVDPSKPALNAPTVQWMEDFLARLHAKGYQPVISVSFEILNRYMPTAWKQRDQAGNEALTGWQPPSSLVSPAVAAALSYLKDVFLACLALRPPGCAPHFQIGEPWWWDGAFGSEAPHIYDATIQAAYVTATGNPVPTPKLTTVTGNPAAIHAPYLAFCRDKLGDATDYLVNQVKAIHPAAVSYLLIFLPQLRNAYAPMLWTLNLPQADWSAGGLIDKLQVEDYDWISGGTPDRLPETWIVAQDVLGYALADIEYLAGFNLLPATAWVWDYTDDALSENLPRGASQYYVWSREQVWRDGWISDRQADMLRGALTHLAQCWRIERTDGVVLGFTSHDRILTLDGLDYSPANSFNASALTADSEMSTGDVDVTGAIDADGIIAADLLAGVYDGAAVELVLVDWSDLTIPRRVIRRGWIGTVRQAGRAFTSELRGLAEKIQSPVIEVVSPGCRVDLYSAPCGISRAAHTLTGVVTAVSDGSLGAVNDSMLFFATALTEASGVFDYGEVLWTSGVNDARKAEIRTFTAGGRIELWEPTPFLIAAGDTFEIYRGCNKTRPTCRDVFANIENFRGFPDVPGGDAIVKYPDAKV